ncbi:hypothetical protein OEA41_008584 [Lepraria neglecta]|uniref:Fe2OG dioxygenase domain-containing protein n=1 Tax=Lepraria neglecta TaxID=209136 RepID=A0AAD9Z0E1_9LECA|nr:hypothetical protein OEA41_008584 [Lepraria neglecta]
MGPQVMAPINDKVTVSSSLPTINIETRDAKSSRRAIKLCHKQQQLFFDFMGNAHNITLMILSRLSDALSLEGSAPFETVHRHDRPSLSTLALFHYLKPDNGQVPGFGHGKHTDIGTLTFLLCEQWGLQVLSPDTESWAFVEPRPNHAVINVGDSPRFISCCKLSSAVHRVIPVQEKQMEDRYSIAYFLRMENDIRYRDSANKTWRNGTTQSSTFSEIE